MLQSVMVYNGDYKQSIGLFVLYGILCKLYELMLLCITAIWKILCNSNRGIITHENALFHRGAIELRDQVSLHKF